ncbi:site-2 protease family protein [Candidatus Berkelbacteria bacterium]|nr:site-2 protease family protein [Candidatus Berkelbacteria bacterium]
MLLSTLFTDPIAVLAFASALVIGISVHEFAHAFVADKLGDPTARHQGRVTLNPLAHLDPLGSVMLFIAGFGWGRPVPVNPRNFERPALDELLVALAGPVSNFLTAAVLGLLYQLTGGLSEVWSVLLLLVIQINLFLMVFNLIPIPPLDGSKLFRVFLGEAAFRALEALSLPLIIGLLILLRSTPLGETLSSLVETLTRVLITTL